MAYIQVPPDSTGKKIHTHETTDGADQVHTQVFTLADRTDPSKQQIVDTEGASYTRFATGSPNFDAFALMLTSEPNLMGSYKFYEGAESTRFYKNEVGGATVAADAAMGSLKFTCGTASGDLVQYYTNRRFAYRPGASIGIMFTMKASDAGKTNVRRRIGMFGDNGEHICFEMDELAIYVSVYNNLTGAYIRVQSTS